MRKKQIKFHIDDIIRMTKELKEGKPVVYPSSKTHVPPYDTLPLLGFSYDTKFPDCCETHTNISLFVNDWYDNSFPNCCDFHKEMSKEDWFVKEDFKYVVSQTIDKISYFIHLFEALIDTDKWYSEITDYYDYVCDSFGTHIIGLDPFDSAIKHYIKGVKSSSYEVLENQRIRLLEHIDSFATEEERNEKELGLLINTYKNWLKYLPEIEYFESIKEKYSNGAPVASSKRYNRFRRAYVYTIRTKAELIEFLTNTTKKMLSEIDTVQLVKDGLIKDITKTKIDLVHEHHAIKQKADLELFDKGQMKYIKYLKRWLKNEKKYFIEIEPLLKKAKKPKLKSTKEDISFSNLFRNSSTDIDIFFELIKREQLGIIDHQSNWIYDGNKSSIVACFQVLQDLRTIKRLNSKSELSRVVKTTINYEGSEKLFRSPYDSADYHFFEKLFTNTALNKHKS